MGLLVRAVARALTWGLPLALGWACGGESTTRNEGRDAAGGQAGDAGRGIAGEGKAGRPGTGGAAPSAGGAASGRGGAPPRGGSSGSGGNAGGEGGASTGEGGEGGDRNAGSGGTSASGGIPTLGECREPTVYSANVEACEGGYVHRPVARACALPVRDEDIPNLPPDAGQIDLEACEYDYPDGCTLSEECVRDADCGAGRYCLYDDYEDYFAILHMFHECHTACETDDDCAAGEICVCDYLRRSVGGTFEVGICKPATCRSDADCGDWLCVVSVNPLSQYFMGNRLEEFHCQTPEDTCHGPEPCPPAEPGDVDCCPRPFCRYVEERFECTIEDTCDPC